MKEAYIIGIILHVLENDVEIYVTFPLETITGVATIISSSSLDGERRLMTRRHQRIKR